MWTRDLSDETYVAFGRLTVAFGRLEGTVDWLMSMLKLHNEGKGHPYTVWKWPLAKKLDEVKAQARAIPTALSEGIVSFAGSARVLASERRRLVHAFVMDEIDPPTQTISIYRMGDEGGPSQDFVSISDVTYLASRIEAATNTGRTLVGAVEKLIPAT